MTDVNRIVLNAVATYGRSLFALALGLFSSRWALMALGEQDYGLFGVVGGLISFVSIFCEILRGSIARYYAYAIGEGKKLSDNNGGDVICRWFNAAVAIHIIVLVGAILIGYPVLAYIVKKYLIIPELRMSASIWVLRFAFLLAVANLFAVPYLAMFTARQNIAELSAWGVIQSVCMFIATYILLSYRGDRLVAYGACFSFVPILISLIQTIRARTRYSACRIKLMYLVDSKRIRDLVSFAGWTAVGSLGVILQNNGIAVIVNRFFGLGTNAAMGVATQVSHHTTSLSSALQSALTPAVTTAEGSGAHDKCISYGFRCCKFGSLLIYIFSIPLIVEVKYVLSIWLKVPPVNAELLCVTMLAVIIITKFSWGHQLVVSASGKVHGLQMLVFISSAFVVVLAVISVLLIRSVVCICIALLVGSFIQAVGRVIIAKYISGMSVRFWLYNVAIPLVVAFVVTLCIASIPMMFARESFMRLMASCFLSTIALLSISWIVVLDRNERAFFVQSIHSTLRRIKGCLL